MLATNNLWLVVAVLWGMPPVLDAFVSLKNTHGPTASRLSMVASPPPPPPPPPPGGDGQRTEGLGGIQPEEEFNLEERGVSVDWDAEWKKVVQEQKAGGGGRGRTVPRPGDGFYKSEVEITAIRAANRATEQMNRAARQLPSLPTWNSLKGDWKVRMIKKSSSLRRR